VTDIAVSDVVAGLSVGAIKVCVMRASDESRAVVVAVLASSRDCSGSRVMASPDTNARRYRSWHSTILQSILSSEFVRA
jgi:hypothetical protein